MDKEETKCASKNDITDNCKSSVDNSQTSSIEHDSDDFKEANCKTMKDCIKTREENTDEAENTTSSVLQDNIDQEHVANTPDFTNNEKLTKTTTSTEFEPNNNISQSMKDDDDVAETLPENANKDTENKLENISVADMIRVLKQGQEELSKDEDAQENWRQLKIYVKEQKAEIQRKRQLSAKSKASISTDPGSSKSIDPVKSKSTGSLNSTKSNDSHLDKEELLLFRYLLFVKMQEKQKEEKERAPKKALVKNVPNVKDISLEHNEEAQNPESTGSVTDKDSTSCIESSDRPEEELKEPVKGSTQVWQEDNVEKIPPLMLEPIVESEELPHEDEVADTSEVISDPSNEKPSSKMNALDESKLNLNKLSDIIIALKRERTNLVSKNNLKVRRNSYPQNPKTAKTQENNNENHIDKETKNTNCSADDLETPKVKDKETKNNNFSEDDLEHTDLFLIRYLKFLKAKKVKEHPKKETLEPNNRLSKSQKVSHLRDLIAALKAERDYVAQDHTIVTQEPAAVHKTETTKSRSEPNTSKSVFEHNDMLLLRYLALLKVQADKKKHVTPIENETPKKTTVTPKEKKTPRKTPKKKRKMHDKASMEQMIIDSLMDATDKGERERLELAIIEFMNADIEGKNELLFDAMDTLDLIRTKESLEDAIEKGNTDRLKYGLEYCEKMEYEEKLKPQLQKAHTMVYSDKIDTPSLESMRCNVSELRRYSKPHLLIHSVVKATLLLLNEHEGTTKKWKKCQALLTPLGQRNLLRKTGNFSVDRLHSRMVARAKQLLSNADSEEVEEASGCLSTLYNWSMNMIAEYEFRHGAVEDVKPAKRSDQKRILRRMASEGAAKDKDKPLGLPMIDFVQGGRHKSMVSISVPNTPRKHAKFSSFAYMFDIYKGRGGDENTASTDEKKETEPSIKREKTNMIKREKAERNLKNLLTPRRKDENDSQNKSRFPKVQSKPLIQTQQQY